MTASTEHPIMSQAEAVALGFAGFNDVPHKPIDVPDGEYTITARPSDGRRVTFCFLPDRERSHAGYVDIQYCAAVSMSRSAVVRLATMLGRTTMLLRC